jgi:hypothetical protein
LRVSSLISLKNSAPTRQNVQELANRWADEGKRQYEELAREWRELAERLDDRRRAAAPQAVLAHG